MNRVIGVLALCLVSFSSLADCQPLLADLAKPFAAKVSMNTELSTCKVWPYAPDKTIAVLMLEPKEEAQPDFTDFDVAVLVVDSQTGKVLASKYHPKAIMDDAIYTSSVTIDTARYQLSPAIRAFGVRFIHRGSSSVNPLSIERLNLYTLQDRQVTLVLNNLTMNEYSGEWDGQCAGDFATTHRALALGKNAHHGFQDLQLQTMATHKEASKKGEDCVESNSIVAKTRVELKFDGKAYPVEQDKLLEHRF
ncbi:hypothetical protein BFS14_01160 [Serratia fonticola]|uniref:hypothetical protein n=1 Tax=Serratia fonticola TaxID=47917 RepID=UPI0008FCE486|nr:hypothetical protein [Serratia fonticola]OIX96101.1 hypothetical protein BFS14_01160 [Serratia fonticola]QCR60970.1 hypothetical protein FD644_11605 [Serratia fonticola]